MIGTLRDVLQQVPPPRAVFIDFPVGRTFGRPGDATQHQRLLLAALSELPGFSEPGQIRDLPDQWAGADRSWEEIVRAEILGPGR